MMASLCRYELPILGAELLGDGWRPTKIVIPTVLLRHQQRVRLHVLRVAGGTEAHCLALRP